MATLDKHADDLNWAVVGGRKVPTASTSPREHPIRAREGNTPTKEEINARTSDDSRRDETGVADERPDYRLDPP